VISTPSVDWFALSPELILLTAAGIAPLIDYAGTQDPYGMTLRASMLAVADELASAAELVMGKIAAVKRNILGALRGELMSSFVAICSDGFYDAFVSHANVKTAFQYFQNGGQTLADDFSGGSVAPNAQGIFAAAGRAFNFGGVAWINYTGSVTDAAGSSQPLVDTDSAYLFPMGTSVFKTWYAPADYIETVNTEGLPFYAKQELAKFGKGIEVECQSNPLPICLKPSVIQKLTKT